MITAQDIREKTFEKSTFGGYAMNEVDDFLDDLASDLAASQKETATLRSKMKVLVEKIEEYRESEDAMHLALVSAQKVAKSIQEDSQAQADELLANARAEAEAIVTAAKAEAEAITGGIIEQRQTEELRLQKAQSAAADYIQKFRMLLEHESAFLDTLAESDFVSDVIVTPAPEEPRAIAAPPEEAAAQEAAAAVTEAVENADEKAADYADAFEKAVFSLGGEDAILEADDGDDAPSFRF